MQHVFMKRIIPPLLFLLASIPFTGFSQQKPFKTKNVIWFLPNEANRINGLAAGFQAMNVNDDSLTINGMSADLGLATVMALPYIVDWELKSRTKKQAGFMEMDTAFVIVNGLSASMFGELGITVNGVNLTFGITGAAQLNGLSVSGFFTKSSSFKGVCISGLHNVSKKGRGIQIAIFNTCKDLKGIQIGLWNKSGKRGLPFFNWGF